jgi:hypothetical protein
LAKEISAFRTMTKELLEMRVGFLYGGVTDAGMESTGVHRKRVYTVLGDDFEVIVGNAWHMRNVPGRKTDVKGTEWLADLAGMV